ncbi:uncharacterized protein BKA78DRAFT_372606 [Phyllosticta capitalensis]|uniref:uncharacterized protein n=1 Tax=Phyllosticta capitalensis TaxID=121624 RepID=UPI0031326C16
MPTSRVPHGPADVDPKDWAQFTGTIPKRRSPLYHCDTRWPRHRVLTKDHAIQVLQKYHCEDCPGKLQKDFIPFYLRNFDSEGFLVDSGLTASLPRFTLPLDSELAQGMMEEAQREEPKKTPGIAKQKPTKKLTLSSAAKKKKTNTAKSNGNIVFDFNENSNTSTYTISRTETRTTTDITSDGGTTAPAEPATPRLHLVAEKEGHRLGEKTLEPVSPTSTMKSTPSAVLKRIAEPQKLKQENKRLKTENSEQESKIDSQELQIAKLSGEVFEKQQAMDRVEDLVEKLGNALEERESEISALESESQERDERLIELEAELQQQEERRSALEKSLQQLQSAKLASEADAQRQKAQFDELEQSMASLGAEMEAKKNMIKELQKLIRQAVDDKMELHEELKEQGNQMTQLQRELKSAESEKAQMFHELEEERMRCEKLQEDKEKKNQFAEAAKRAAARLLYGVNQIYDQLAEDGNDEEKNEFLGAIKDDLGDHYGPLLNWGKCMAEQDF